MRNELVLSDRLARQRAHELLRVARRRQNQLIESARKNWETHFAGHDPSDACVRVRIHPSNAQPALLSA